MSNIKKLPISNEAKRRIEAGFLLDSGQLNKKHPRMTADENGRCRMCGYDLEGGVVCCQSLDDYDECGLKPTGATPACRRAS
jgi:hypothetical protein